MGIGTGEVLLLFYIIVLHILPGLWVFKDARRRGLSGGSSGLWGILALLLSVIGLGGYLLLNHKPDAAE